MSEVILKIMDEVTCTFVGLHGHHTKQLVKMFAKFAPGFRFSPLYKRGAWDGRINFFFDSGRTYVYLLDQILPHVVGWGYHVTIDDRRISKPSDPPLIDCDLYAHIPHADSGNPTILRDHQVEAVNAVLAAGSGVIIASTGAGKTLICTAICDVYGREGLRTITIVPSQDLIKQTKADYEHYGLDVGEYSGTTKNADRQHVVSTWQALQNFPELVSQFQVLIVDECHLAKGKVLQELVTKHGGQILHRFGMTGTLPKEDVDRLAINMALGDVRYTVNAAKLIDVGVLSDLHIDIVQLEEDLSAEYADYCKSTATPVTYAVFKDGYIPDFTAEKKYLHKNPTRIQWIATLIEQKRDERKGNVLCLVDGITFGKQLSAAIPGSVFVNGQDFAQKDRKDVYDRFKGEDSLVVIATVHVAGTGLSINRIFNLVLVDPGKSFIRVIQAIGRGLRQAKDKNFVNVYDICSDLKYGKRHMSERIAYYKEAQYPYTKQKVQYVLPSDQ